jgi:hypothetical protein
MPKQMAPRKAVIIGSLILLGIGALTVAFFGSMLSHWYAKDELWVFSRFNGGFYVSHATSPFVVDYYLGFYFLGVVFGGVCLIAALYGTFLLARQARRNRSPTG